MSVICSPSTQKSTPFVGEYVFVFGYAADDVPAFQWLLLAPSNGNLGGGARVLVHLGQRLREALRLNVVRGHEAQKVRQRREPRLGNTGSSRFRLNAKSLEDVPVPLSRLYDLAMGLSEQIFAKSERLLDRAGRAVDARVGGDPNDGTQCQWRQAKAGVAHHHAREPRTTNRMLG